MRIKVERRLEMPKFSGIMIPVISILISLLIMGIAIVAMKSGLPNALVDSLKSAERVYVEKVRGYFEKYGKGDWLENRRKLSSRMYSAFWNFKMSDVGGALRNYQNSLGYLEKVDEKGYNEYIGSFEALSRSFQDNLNDSFKKLDTGIKSSESLEKAREFWKEHVKEVDDIISDFRKSLKEVTNPYWMGFMAVVEAYSEMFTWPFTLGKGLGDTFMKMVPLLFIGLGLIVVFQMRIWNIGAEGQYYLGVLATTWGALFLFKNPGSFHIPLLLTMGALAGAFWGAIPGFLKAYLNMDEIVTTLMLNYVAFHWMEYLVYGPWKSPKGYNFPLTEMYPEGVWLPTFGDGSIHAGLILGLIMALVVYVLMFKTRWGFDLRITGDNQNAARYAGINIKSNIVMAMMLSGALAGLAGSVQMLGVEHMLQHGYHPGYGYTGIIIAWLSRLNPWAVIVVSFLFGGLIVGGEQLQITLQLPIAMINILQGILLFSLLGSEVLFKYRVRIVKG